MGRSSKEGICLKEKDEIDSIAKVLGEEVARGLVVEVSATVDSSQALKWMALLAT